MKGILAIVSGWVLGGKLRRTRKGSTTLKKKEGASVSGKEHSTLSSSYDLEEVTTKHWFMLVKMEHGKKHRKAKKRKEERQNNRCCGYFVGGL